MSTHEVTHNASESRYEIHVDDKLAGFAVYVDQGDRLNFVHTEVADAYEGQGLAAILVTGALDDVRAKGRLIQADCPYVARFLSKHAHYRDLLA